MKNKIIEIHEQALYQLYYYAKTPSCFHDIEFDDEYLNKMGEKLSYELEYEYDMVPGNGSFANVNQSFFVSREQFRFLANMLKENYAGDTSFLNGKVILWEQNEDAEIAL